MLHFIRKIVTSRVGALLGLAMLIIIALAFASGDVADNTRFGGVAGGDRVAIVGSEKISTSALSEAATSALERVKADNPRLSMKSFLAAGGLAKVLDELIDRTAVAEFGKRHKIVASDALIDSEIVKIPAFQGPDGKFNESAYRQLLQQRGLNDKLVRDDLGAGLIARQILVPAAFGAVTPRELAVRYAALLRETRTGSIALIPSASFASKTPPSQAELASYYAANRNRFIRPERRVIRYVSFDDSVLKSVPAPTEAEIAARYKADAAKYAASEKRSLTQLILPTEAAAREILAEVTKGTSLDAAARSKGLATAQIGPIDQQDLATQSSPAVAQAAFSAARGAIAGPARSGLGWHLLKVDAIENRPARSLDQARSEIVAELTAEKRRAALNDFTAKIEDQLDNGGNLVEAAKQLGVTPAVTPPLTADGQVYGQPGRTAPPELAKVIPTAFTMEHEEQPQLAEVEPGKRFVVFDVTQITPSAPAPLAEVADQVKVLVMLQKGTIAAKAAADKVAAAARKGTDLSAAIGAVGLPLPPVDKVSMSRQQLTAQYKQVPPPLGLLFSMAQHTVKLLPAPNDRGWYVVSLASIQPGQIAANDPIIEEAQKGLGQITGREYAEALRNAMRAEVGVSRNPTAIKSVSTQLAGGS